MENFQEKEKPKEDQPLCQCGKPTETKPATSSWGNISIQACTDPNCPCKKERQKKKVGWGE
ncbi:MAG: hypothetical protein WC460_00010 [Patescibacteria group bacterium]